MLSQLTRPKNPSPAARRSGGSGNTPSPARRIARVRPSLGLRKRRPGSETEGTNAMPAIRFNIDVLNAVSRRARGRRRARRSVAALNEICQRLGGAGGHRRTLAALQRVGGAGRGRGRAPANARGPERDRARARRQGRHRRTLAALEEIRDGGGPAVEAITSGSVRAQMMANAVGTFAGGERVTHRLRDRTNVAIARPWFEYFHGRIAASGASGRARGRAGRGQGQVPRGDPDRDLGRGEEPGGRDADPGDLLRDAERASTAAPSRRTA